MSHAHHRLLGIASSLLFALGLSTALLLVASAHLDAPLSPSTPVIRYVSTTGDNNGNDCSNSASPCHTLQHAVGVAVAGDEIRVSEGTYQGTQTITRTLYWEVYSYTQVLYINKPLTVRGGYSTADWNVSDPQARPTVIDAQRSGRGVTIIDSLSEPVNLEGFTITGGDYTGLGNPFGVGNYVCDYTSSDCGGGILITRSTANLRKLLVWDNIAGQFQSEGGGIHIDDAWALTIEDSRIISNSAQLGGGLFVGDQYAAITIRDSIFQDNIAYGNGGAIDFGFGADYLVTIEQTDFLSNTAVATYRGSGQGGALYVRLAEDGLILSMNRIRLQNNRGEGLGKVIHLDAAGNYTPTARLNNVLLTGNGLPEGVPVTDEDALISVGPGFTNLNAYFAHVTAADNAVGGFLYAETHSHDADLFQVALTNTLLSGFDNAFIASEYDPARLIIAHDHTLFENVTNQLNTLAGSPTFTATNEIVGNALLDTTYHLQSGSDAIDTGMEAGVADDIDGEFRPQGAGPDIGADEYLKLVAPAALTISGPTTVVANTDNTFLAEVGPIDVTRPLTYYWSATGLSDVVHNSGSLSDTASFNWPTTGPKTISLTVANSVAGRGETYAVTVIPAPSLSIEKSGPAEALAGSPILYSITVANSGVAGASSLVITDTVPANVTSASPLDGGTLNNGVMQWNVANLAGGSDITVRFQVSANQTIVNEEYAVIATGGYAAVGETPVTTVVGQPQLSIVKSGPMAAAPGQGIVYELTISNTGPISATNLVVSDTLPAGASHVSGGQLFGDVVRWEIPSVAGNGGSAQVSFTASADATVTNNDYLVKAAGGFEAQGTVPVSTIIGAGTRYVATGGNDGLNNCTNSAAPCATIQHAVNVANPGEEIRVAGGTYAGASWITSDLGYDYKQVVFVDKGLTLRGGYSVSEWSNADPLSNVTILDALGDGRGITILNTENDVV
ncbi:MAG: choice-of-anchor Q domain-containing protein, partial [Chloroflexota bacterium]